MTQDLAVEEFVVPVHVLDHDLQHVVAITGNRKALGHLRQNGNVLLETLAVVVRMFGHSDE